MSEMCNSVFQESPKHTDITKETQAYQLNFLCCKLKLETSKISDDRALLQDTFLTSLGRHEKTCHHIKQTWPEGHKVVRLHICFQNDSDFNEITHPYCCRGPCCPNLTQESQGMRKEWKVLYNLTSTQLDCWVGPLPRGSQPSSVIVVTLVTASWPRDKQAARRAPSAGHQAI